MGTAFGFDFGRVRVYADSASVAPAYAVGDDIAFQPGRYAPHTQAGNALLAHELAHVVQQSDAAKGTTPASPSTPSQEREASQAGALVAAGVPAGRLSRSPAQFVGRADENVSLGFIDSPIFAAAASQVTGSGMFAFVREMLRGFVGGMNEHLAAGGAQQLKDRLTELTTSFAAIRAYLWGYMKGLAKGLASPVIDLWSLVKSVYSVLTTVAGWVRGAGELFNNPAELILKFAQLAARFDELMSEAGGALVSFIKNPSGSADAFSKLVAALTEKALGSARSLGHSAADKVFDAFGPPWEELGEKVGYAVGMLVVQVVMLAFSEAIGNAIEAALQAGAKFGAIVAEGAATALRFIAGLGRKLVAVFDSAAEALAGVFGGLWAKFKGFFETFATLCDDAISALHAPALAGGPEGNVFLSEAAKGSEIAPAAVRKIPTTVEDLRAPKMRTEALQESQARLQGTPLKPKRAPVAPADQRLASEAKGATLTREEQLAGIRMRSEVESVREATPTKGLRKATKLRLDTPRVVVGAPDPAFPSSLVEAVEADHIFPLDKMYKLKGAAQLERAELIEVANTPENLAPISRTVNGSRKNMSYREWAATDPLGRQANSAFIETMTALEDDMERLLQAKVDALVRARTQAGMTPEAVENIRTHGVDL